MGVEGSSGESPARGPRKRSGPVRTALRKALTERKAAAGSGWTPALEVSAAIALRYAEQVDRQDGAAMVRAAEQLTDLMVTLGLTPRAGVTPTDGDGDSRGPDERARLLLVMDSPPTLGNTADA